MYKRADLSGDLDRKSYLKADLKSCRVVVRTCLNVPVKEEVVQDLTRIRESLPLIKELQPQVKRLVMLAHLGRPEGKDPSQSLKPVLKILEQELGEKIVFAEEADPAWIDANTVDYQKDQRLVLVENIRFFPGENSKDAAAQADFAGQLAQMGDIFINDAFPDYRESPSTYGVAKLLPSYLGPAILKEVNALAKFDNPRRPFVAILAGAKLSEKLDSLNALLSNADKVMIGGALAYTILKAKGNTIGNSLIENDKLDVAREVLARFGDKLLLPIDHVAVKEFKKPAHDSGYTTVASQDIPDGLIGVDIGPSTQRLYAEEIAKANSILWNGPVGVYEWGKTAEGTDAIIAAMTANDHAYKLIGGGDSITVTNQMSVTSYDHICTGGGAMLAFLAYEKFPILDVILDQP